MGKELLVVARPVARSTAFAEQVQELPANPPPHRCLDADRLEGGIKGGGLPPGLVAGAKPPCPLPPNCACCVCIRCIACVCLRQCACVRACICTSFQLFYLCSIFYPLYQGCRQARQHWPHSLRFAQTGQLHTRRATSATICKRHDNTRSDMQCL